MKKIYQLLIALVATAAFTACTKEVDDVFNKSAAQRIDEAITSYQATLTAPANGWLMEYYGATEYGGYNMFVKFNTDNTVTVSNEVYGPGQQQTSHYKLEQSQGVVLSFDQYNPIFHFFSDPANPAGVGTNGKGMEGDLEFRIMKATADSVIMVGKKHNSRIVMTPAATDWDGYISTVKQSEEDMAFASYFFIVGNDTAFVDASYHQLTFTYPDPVTSELITVEAPYILKPNSYHLYKPVEVLGKTITDFTYKGGDDYLFTSNDPEAVMKGYVMPVADAFVNGEWFVSYANMSPAVQQYWQFAAPGHLAKEGETIDYAYFSAGILLISSGGYWSGFDMGATVLSENQVSLKVTAYAGNSSQKRNAQYYWASKAEDGNYYFRYFILPLQGTFELKGNDVRNPTQIQLTDVEDPTMSFIVTKQTIPATTGM